MKEERSTTITSSNAHGISEGDIIYITYVKDDPSIWKWILAFIFRKNRPEIEVTEKCICGDIPDDSSITVDAKWKEV
jgi:hypothetical protein